MKTTLIPSNWGELSRSFLSSIRYLIVELLLSTVMGLRGKDGITTTLTRRSLQSRGPGGDRHLNGFSTMLQTKKKKSYHREHKGGHMSCPGDPANFKRDF
jgi:hypothetical protein